MPMLIKLVSFLAIMLLLVVVWVAVVSVSVDAVKGSTGNIPLAELAVVSCNKHDRNQSFWEVVQSSLHPSHRTPTGLVWLGDVVYADTSYGPGIWVQSSDQTMQAKYDSLKANPFYSRLRDTVDTVAGVWDDHDMGCNDGGKDCETKSAVKKMFLGFLDVPSTDPRWVRDGVYSLTKIPFRTNDSCASRSYDNAICLILLDVRFNRDPIVKERVGTVLGETQWSWLEQTLKTEVVRAPHDSKEKCAVTLIGSGIQILSDEKPTEQWAHFPAERTRLYNLLRKTGAQRVVFLSGDVHLAEIQREPKEQHPSSLAFEESCERGGLGALGYPIVELTTSGLTHSVGELLNPAVFDYILPTPRRISRLLNRNFLRLSLQEASIVEEPSPEGDDLRCHAPNLKLVITFFDLDRKEIAFEHVEDLTSLNSKQSSGCRRPGDAVEFGDAPFPPVKRALVYIQTTIFPQLLLHQVIYIVLFSVGGLGALSLAVVVWLLVRRLGPALPS